VPFSSKRAATALTGMIDPSFYGVIFGDFFGKVAAVAVYSARL